MAFVDAVFHESDSTFTIVDRRHAPGGHWNDAYPFVMLHQPAATYGVASRPLGSTVLATTGLNAGSWPLASGGEVASHFHSLMSETLLPSGRVTYLPMTEHLGDGVCVSLLSGQRTTVEATTVVDATMLETAIPLTSRRAFDVSPDATCIPPNELPRVATGRRHFTVLGAGKTGLDTVCWLLVNGAAPEQISWVVPRDPWMLNRRIAQPGTTFMSSTANGLAAQTRAVAAAQSIYDLAQRMEAAGVWMRLDPQITPTMYHAATVGEAELEQVRRVRDVVRLGHVVEIELTRLILDGGTHPTPEGTVFVDCTASALRANVGVVRPVFQPGLISLQMLRLGQPTFSAALIGHIEATIGDDDERARLTAVSPMIDTVEDWIAGQAISMRNEAAWASNRAVRKWMAGCRLNILAS